MRRLKLSIFILASLLTLAPIHSDAASLEKLPSSQSSKQWSVVIGKADSENAKDNQSEKPHLYNVYSMDIKHLGDEDVNLVSVEAYRDEPKSNTEYELFSTKSDKLIAPYLHHHNFTLSTKATKLYVTITWTKKSNDIHQRKYREQFIFQQ